MSNELELKLDVFSGPLDLLLHLIKKLEIDIYDIPIVEITTQYMNYIHQMQDNQLEVAGDYIVMASTLMSIKSQMLIPLKETELETELEEYVDPRQELVDQLLIYQKFQEASHYLDELQTEQLKYYSKEATNLEKYQAEDIQLTADLYTCHELQQLFTKLMQASEEEQTTIIKPDKETIQEAVDYLTTYLTKQQQTSFWRLFKQYDQDELVVTFLAMLELIKTNFIEVKQDEPFADIMIHLK